MKKTFLFICLLGTTGLFAQNIDKSKISSPVNFHDQRHENPVTNPSEIKGNAPADQSKTEFKGTAAVNPIAIGEAGNVWGFAYHRTTYLWANNDINSISFIHRMTVDPGTGYLAYDLSTDRGMNWSVNNQVYDPTLDDADDARYPQGALYNPAGNTDPESAYFTYFAPTLDGSNTAGASNWGGYAWGTKKLAEGALPMQSNLASSSGFYQYLPSGFTITQLGEAWMVDEENDGSSGGYVYTNQLIVGHGLWNDGTEEFDYTFDHMELVINPDKSINDVKIAFAPDGMTGWICALSTRIPALEYTSYHPILFKTTDGGQSWSEDPIEVQLGGEDGLEAVREFITDEELESFYSPDPVPPRDEIPYYMGYHMDIAVDAWGNPHILGIVAICDLESGTWYHGEGLFAMFHIYSKDQGETWEAFNIDYLVTFDYEYTGGGSSAVQYNRPQVATTEDGRIVFFSFLDTRKDYVEENSEPDIFFREYIPEFDLHGDEVVNVTFWSAAWYLARWGCMSHYVFAEIGSDGTYECTIPFVYEELTNFDPSLPVQFWYIPDFTRTYQLIVGIDDNPDVPRITVADNFPNPFRERTHFNINVLEKSLVTIDVFNSTGQLIESFDFGFLNNGPHQLKLEFQDLKDGVYFYHLRAGNSSAHGKMIAK